MSHKYVFDAVRRHDETTIIVTMRCETCADRPAQEFPITAEGLGRIFTSSRGEDMMVLMAKGVDTSLLDQLDRNNNGVLPN